MNRCHLALYIALGTLFLVTCICLWANARITWLERENYDMRQYILKAWPNYFKDRRP